MQYAQMGPSFGELAEDVIPGNYTTVLKYMPSLNETTLPQNVATLRKALLYLRDLLDVFVWVYPLTPNQPGAAPVSFAKVTSLRRLGHTAQRHERWVRRHRPLLLSRQLTLRQLHDHR